MPTSNVSWPDGARAAVSLTYDDALASQLDNAVVALKERGLRATFFITTASPGIAGYEDRWKALLDEGHELGNHTQSHPCTRDFDWVPKGQALEDLDEQRMAAQIDESAAVLRSWGAKNVRSFAYPCGMTFIGEDRHSYVPLVKERFTFARLADGNIAEPLRVDLYQVPAVDAVMAKGNLTAALREVEQSGGWLVIIFHGVDGDHMSIARERHDAILDYLAERRGSIWTAPFSEVAEHVRKLQSER